tara:strand:+ start:353609 stop:354739 length:1131 start_codon:yes stop_codon:yes gene_type:complete
MATKPKSKAGARARKKATAGKAPAKRKAAVSKRPASKNRAGVVRKKVAARTTGSKAGPKNKSDAGYGKAAWNRRAAEARQPLGQNDMMKALLAEHRHIATVMHLFSGQLDAIERGELIDTHVAYEVMDYMVTWPDRFHHPREDLIYGRVADIDPKAADDVDTLQRDHDKAAKQGRAVLDTIQQWRDGRVDGAAVVRAGRAYIDHMYQHMNYEEKVVFPHIESVLSLQDWRELTEDDRLQAVSAPVFGVRVQREFRNMARKLRRSLRRGVEHGTMVEWIGIEALMESLEVMSMAVESARDVAGRHVRTVWRDSVGLCRESLLTAPLRCATNNLRLSLRFAGDMADLSKDTLDDLARVNRERKDRMRLLDEAQDPLPR